MGVTNLFFFFFFQEMKMSPGILYQHLLRYSGLVTDNLFKQRFVYDPKVVAAANLAKEQWLWWLLFSMSSLEDNE